MIDCGNREHHQLLMDVCESNGLPSDRWIFWIPAYYKKNTGELDVPEVWTRFKTDTDGEYRAYIRPNDDIRIKESLSVSYLVEEKLKLGED